jgi:hypothetical protein
MMERETGGPAFPVGDVVERDEKGHLHGPVISSVGMTLLDYFAAKAMPALLADGHLAKYGYGAVAENAYLMANQMLAARAISKATGE